ncbi:alkene reductase [Paraburkholderia fynbosensis]|uniref:N-ethylmaleimide reductase n=1 Tax=Paraburkholderia fynbosensis TaxID=1200993 RepID=A0A6J5GSR7_9BURK|nr:alkene reductase [Paraburkholderia fynbosensis]CAB3804784.1 N-ethylmaleimide reductase [Paraburkholderia fynbosensis]
MSSHTLFDPLKLGALELPNRIVMAPLTRMRAGAEGAPTELNAKYYAQRASAGLIVTEATQISQQAKGYPGTPGIHSDAQIAGWRKVTDAVHARGGRIVLQLWHTGAISHPSNQPDHAQPVAPSAVRPTVQALTSDYQWVDSVMPRALAIDELPGIVEQFANGARNAKAAGFDGVEVHGANGYLLDQFLQDRSNHRTDAYGGSFENRARLLLDVLDAVIAVWGKDRVSVRLSPHGTLNDPGDSNPVGLFTHVIGRISERRPAYLHLIEPRGSLAGMVDELNDTAPDNARLFRTAFAGPVISAGGYTKASASAAVEEGRVDAVAFGRYFIANPDLVERLQQNTPLNAYDRPTFYGGDATGYTDYPATSTVDA